MPQEANVPVKGFAVYCAHGYFETGAPKRDAIPLEHEHETHGPSDTGMMTHRFYAFNTVVTLQAYADPDRCRTAFEDARAACRSFERSLSRTLPHSDIARLNAAEGASTPLEPILPSF